MLEVRRDDFDENLEDIMESINGILKKTGKGFETEEEEEKEKKGAVKKVTKKKEI